MIDEIDRTDSESHELTAIRDSSVHVGDLDLVTHLDVIYIPEVKNSLEGGTLGLSVELLTDRLFFLLPAVLFFRWGRSVFAIGRKV